MDHFLYNLDTISGSVRMITQPEKVRDTKNEPPVIWAKIQGIISESIYVGKTDMVLTAETEEQFTKIDHCLRQGLIFNILLTNPTHKDRPYRYDLFTDNPYKVDQS